MSVTKSLSPRRLHLAVGTWLADRLPESQHAVHVVSDRHWLKRCPRAKLSLSVTCPTAAEILSGKRCKGNSQAAWNARELYNDFIDLAACYGYRPVWDEVGLLHFLTLDD